MRQVTVVQAIQDLADTMAYAGCTDGFTVTVTPDQWDRLYAEMAPLWMHTGGGPRAAYDPIYIATVIGRVTVNVAS